jgi:general transcription factor 3C polypeptide 5 (transcription factor C subunit 1)
VKQSIGKSGELETFNTSSANKVLTHLVPYDIAEVPAKPREDLAPIESLDRSMRETIAIVNALYEKQPAWTRRGLRNNLKTDEQRTNLRHAIPYIGYIFRSGPWRDAIIKLGVDPRTSPEYRHYQTFMFRLLAREAEVARDGAGGRRGNVPRPSDTRTLDKENPFPASAGHIFSGKLPFSPDGRIWMIGDITDPQIRADLYPENPEPGFLRTECEIVTDGWFGNGTIAKAKTIMRSKIQAMMEGRDPDDADYVRILEFPAHVDLDSDFSAFTVDMETSSSKEIALATEVRSCIRSAPFWRGLTGDVGLGGKEKGKEKKKNGKSKGKNVEFEVDDQDQSEGEEEEIERQEMLAAQVAAAAEARDAAEEDAANGDGNESDHMDEDEDE